MHIIDLRREEEGEDQNRQRRAMLGYDIEPCRTSESRKSRANDGMRLLSFELLVSGSLSGFTMIN